MADFGFTMGSLTGLGTKNGFMNRNTDKYNPYAPNLGNTALPPYPCELNPATGSTYLSSINSTSVDWVYLDNYQTDFRMFWVECSNGHASAGVL